MQHNQQQNEESGSGFRVPGSGSPDSHPAESNGQQATGTSGDTGHPSMLEELARGIPGSFVVKASELHRRDAEDAGLRTQDSGPAFAVDGGFIMGPGLDDVERVVGVVNVGCGMSDVGCAGAEPETRNPEPDSSLPDHRAFDAVVKAEQQKRSAAMAVSLMISARMAMLLAWKMLSGMGVESANAAVVAAGIDRLLVVDAPCPCNEPCCNMTRRMAQVNVKAGDGTWVQLLWEVPA